MSFIRSVLSTYLCFLSITRTWAVFFADEFKEAGGFVFSSLSKTMSRHEGLLLFYSLGAQERQVLRLFSVLETVPLWLFSSHAALDRKEVL